MSAAISPWTPAEEDRIVAAAVRFIRKRLLMALHDFAMEVGEHLFKELFRGDRDLYRFGGPWKKQAISRIAGDPRVELADDVLYMCINTYMSVTLFQKRAPRLPVPRFSPWKWHRMSTVLEHDPEALVEVAVWVEREGVPERLVRAAAHLVGPYVKRGGKLQDLLVGREGERRFPDSPYRRITRLLAVAQGWMDAHTMTETARQRSLEAVERLLLVVDAGAG